MTSLLSASARPLILSLLSLLSTPAPSIAQQTGRLPFSTSILRVNTSRADVNVTVTDSHGGFVNGLRRDDFRVFDNGVERPITAFASNEDPAQVVLLIECGTADHLLAKLGSSLFVDADMFLNRISSNDRIAVVTYSNRAYVVLGFTSDKLAVQGALKDLNSELLHATVGSNSLNLSSSLAAVLYWLRTVPGKKAIVLLSIGIDTSSPENRQLIQQDLKASDVPLLAVSALGDFRKFPERQKLSADVRDEQAYVKQGMSEADQWLHQLSLATGGHAYFPKNSNDFDRAYAEIAQFVRGEYTLGFVPSLLDGKLHAIAVKVKHPWYRSYRVDHRQAYVAGAPAAK